MVIWHTLWYPSIVRQLVLVCRACSLSAVFYDRITYRKTVLCRCQSPESLYRQYRPRWDILHIHSACLSSMAPLCPYYRSGIIKSYSCVGWFPYKRNRWSEKKKLLLFECLFRSSAANGALFLFANHRPNRSANIEISQPISCVSLAVWIFPPAFAWWQVMGTHWEGRRDSTFVFISQWCVTSLSHPADCLLGLHEHTWTVTIPPGPTQYFHCPPVAL